MDRHPIPVFPVLNDNIQYLNEVFKDCDDVVKRSLWIGDHSCQIYLAYMDSMMDRSLVEGNLLKNLMFELKDIPKEDPLTYIEKYGLTSADVSEETSMEKAIVAILSGDTVIFADQCAKALVISSKDFPSRGVQQAESEVVVRGSKESFSESMRVNTVLIRRQMCIRDR